MPKPLHIAHVIKGEPVALVAGGAGFLGSHLCEKLLETCAVLCLDNLRFGKRANIENCLQNENFTFIEYDITKPLTDLLRKKVNYIFHVAGVDEVARHDKASLDNLLLNTYGTRNLLEKALADKAKFLLVSIPTQARLFSESLTREYARHFGVDGRIVRVEHLFGQRMPLGTALPAGHTSPEAMQTARRQENPMSVIIQGLLEKGEVTLANDELTRVYPVFVTDATSAILRIMFGKDTRGKTFTLLPNHSITLLELSQLLSHVDPHFTIGFSQSGVHIRSFGKEYFDGGQALLLAVSRKEELLAKLQETIGSFKTGKPSTLIKELGTKERRRGFSWRLRGFLLLLSFLFFGVIAPFLFLAATSTLGVLKLNASHEALKKGNFPKAAQEALVSKQFFQGGKALLELLSYHFSLIGKPETKEIIFLLLKSGEDASISTSYLANAGQSLGEFFKKSTRGEGLSAKPLLDGAVGEIYAAGSLLPILEKELDELSEASLPDPIATYVSGRKTMLLEERETIALAQTFAGLLPDLLGFEDKRVYLLLFQNNMELRPGGGFIGSYGILAFEKGSLSSFDVFDVYQADGQLKGHVDPPSAIRKYLGQPNWYLRDSNWDIDFQNAASQALWFLEKEVDVSAHGVIAMDVSFAQFLLEALGPVSLPDYKETITAGNLFEKAQAHSEIGFFPGSTQKKDFLGALARRIIDRMLHEEGGQHPWVSVLAAVRRGVAEKHLLFSFNNPGVQQVFNLENFGGTMLAVAEEEGRFVDFRMISEANLGVNKANFFIKRKVSDEITVGKEGETTGKLSISYTNDSPGAWPGGPYVNYLRVLFPQGTKLLSIAIDGQEATMSAKPKDGGLELEEATQSGKSVFGFLVTVPPQTSKQVLLSYKLPQPYPLLPGRSTYTYIFQKQPGALDDLLSITIHYPQVLRVKNANASIFEEKQLISLSTDLSEDRLFEVEFLR